MLQDQIEQKQLFTITDEWDMVNTEQGNTITVTDTYSIRGTHFIVLDGQNKDIPMYEFKAALRNGILE